MTLRTDYTPGGEPGGGRDTNKVYGIDLVEIATQVNTNTTDIAAVETPTWLTLVGKPAVIAAGATQAEARTAIGAATLADITAAVDALISGAPGALDTLNELAAALGDDANFAATITGLINAKYTKPVGGVPKTDLETAVQTSLGLADTATQPGDLGTAAATDVTDYATAAQGALADTALQAIPDNSVTNAKMADDAVGVAELSATGTPDGTTFLRGDNTWNVPPGGGGGISNIVEDTTPQLGGDLDLNTHTVGAATDADLTKLHNTGALSGDNTGDQDLSGYAPLASPAFTGTPTGITKTHVGLGNVDNTADTAKPVSTAQQNAINAKYTKPVGGVPKTDLETAVQTSLGKADTAYQAPAVVAAGSTQAEARTAIDSPRTSAAMPVFAVSEYYGGTLGAGDDTTCIQATLDAANSAGGGVVVLPPIAGYVYTYSQLVIPKWVRFSGIAWHTFGADGAVARLQQLSGINDDSIIFTNTTTEYVLNQYFGPCGLTDLSLRGAAGATAGHAVSFRASDGTVLAAQDLTTFERLQFRGFAGSGIYLRKAVPVHMSDIGGRSNGRYIVEIEADSDSAIHQVMMQNISGDANMGGVSDAGGAAVLLKDIKAPTGTVVINGIKSEYRKKSSGDGGDDVVMGNLNAIVIDNCSCPVSVNGIQHIATASQSRKPGNVIQIKGPNTPNLSWSAVTVRNNIAGQTEGPDPYIVYDEVLSQGSNHPHGILGLGLNTFSANKIAALVDTERRDELASGESTLPRHSVSGSGNLSPGTLRLTYFSARKTETTAMVRTCTTSTAAAGATLCRVGVYEVDDVTGDLTLVASTANDTALWSAANTAYNTALSSSFVKKRGFRYAVGELIVGASTNPSLAAISALQADELAQNPRLSGLLSGQTDLPATIPAASVSNTTIRIYAALTP